MTTDQQKEYRKLMASFKKTVTTKECFHHKTDECKGDIKQSHSIQRNGRLSIKSQASISVGLRFNFQSVQTGQVSQTETRLLNFYNWMASDKMNAFLF